MAGKESQGACMQTEQEPMRSSVICDRDDWQYTGRQALSNKRCDNTTASVKATGADTACHSDTRDIRQ
jgi:hypothetical protein